MAVTVLSGPEQATMSLYHNFKLKMRKTKGLPATWVQLKIFRKYGKNISEIREYYPERELTKINILMTK